MMEENNQINDRKLSWARRSAAHYLGTYSSSAQNLHTIMRRRALRKFENISEDDANTIAKHAVEFCIEHKFIDDETYSHTKAASGTRKGHSKAKIRLSLEQKGVDRETAEEATQSIDDLLNAIIHAKKKRIGPWRKSEPDMKQRRRELSSFGRNLFPADITIRVLDMNIDEAENILHENKPRF